MSRNYKFVLVRALPKIRRAECDVVEVSRASIAETDFFSIVSQMEQCLPVLQGKTYSIYWRDEDGDFVGIKSERDIQHVFQLLPTQLITLYVEIKDQPAPRPSSNHAHVTCDGCGGLPVVGLRFKCLLCPDYDLCAACESAGKHDAHPMVRLVHPVDPFSTDRCFRRGFLSRMQRSMHTMDIDAEVLQSSSSEEDQCHKKRGHGHKKRHHHDRHGATCDDVAVEERRKRCRAALRAAATAASGAATTAASAAHTIATDPNNLQYLKNIGQAVAKLLDPLGIQVEVQDRPVQSPAAPRTTPENAPTQARPANENTPAAAAAAAVPVSDPPLVDLTRQMEAAVQHISQSLAQQHVDSGEIGWTMLNHDGRNASPPTVATPVAPAASTSQQGGASAYPDLTPHTAAASAPPAAAASSSAAPHRNPMVQRGLESLTAMGYSNEGQLLTQLLEVHNGDIFRVLDVLAVLQK